MLPGAMRHDDEQKSPVQDGDADMDPGQELQGSADADGDDSFEDDVLFREAVDSYRSQSLDWAERRSSTMPVPTPSPALQWWHRTPGSVFAAAILTLLVGAAAVRHHVHQETMNEAAAFVQPSSQTIASDNQLLSSVDAALDQDTVPTEQELGLSVPSRRPPAERLKLQTGTTRNAR